MNVKPGSAHFRFNAVGLECACGISIEKSKKMLNNRKFLICNALALWALASMSVKAAEWYVDATATGTKNGKSWANAWTDVRQAGGLAPGDIVNISGGPVGGEKVYTTKDWVPSGGVKGNHVIYRVAQEPAHAGTVVFDGKGVSEWWCKKSVNVTITGDYQGQTNIVVKGYWLALYADNSVDAKFDHIQMYNAVRFNPGINIELSNCYIQAPNGSDFVVLWNVKPDSYPGSYTNNSIHNCILRGPRQNDSTGMGADIIQAGSCSSVYSNLISPYFVDKFNGGQHQDGWQNNEAGENVRIFANIFENIGNYAVYWEFYNKADFRNLHIFNNVFRHTSSLQNATGYNVGVVVGPQRQSGQTISNVVVANNTFVDLFGRSAIAMGQGGTSNNWVDCKIVNNLTYNCGGGGGSPAIAFENADAFNPTAGSTNGVLLACNQMIKGSRGSSQIFPAQSLAAATLESFKFRSYVELSPSSNYVPEMSPLRGIALGDIFTTDMTGAQRLSWTVGAFESAAASGFPRPPQRLRLTSSN